MASFIDSRQLKICATCFDISVGLLRVLEMIVNLTPQLMVDWSRPSAELLLCRLFQVSCSNTCGIYLEFWVFMSVSNSYMGLYLLYEKIVLVFSSIFQLLTQVLNRVTSRSNMFDMVVSISMPGLETVDHFPILTAVTGILVALIVKANGQR